MLSHLKPIVEHFPTIAQFYRTVRDARAVSRQILRQTPHGFLFAGPAGMQDGTFESIESALIIRLLDHAHRFVDIGAHHGFYSCLARSIGKPVIAFEPDRKSVV